MKVKDPEFGRAYERAKRHYASLVASIPAVVPETPAEREKSKPQTPKPVERHPERADLTLYLI